MIETKQFEGSTPGPWTVATDEFGHERVGSAYGSYGCLITEANGKFGNIIIADVLPITPEINSGMPNARLLAAAPDLLKENQSLRSELQSIKNSDTPIYTHWEMMKRVAEHTRDLNSELQKLKELNAELVKCLEEIVPLAEDGYALHKRNGSHQEFLSEDIERLSLTESLIKKSKES